MNYNLICIISLFGFKAISVQPWNLTFEAKGEKFFDYFDFLDKADPSHGFVNYVDHQTALDNGYINISEGGDVYIGCDHERIALEHGRDSIRIQSKQTFSYGLFILYLSHMPYG